MICLYQRPDQVLLRSSGMDAKTWTHQLNDRLWGQRAGDLHEGVYNETGEFFGSFVEYWHGRPLPQRTGWWSKRILGGK